MPSTLEALAGASKTNGTLRQPTAAYRMVKGQARRLSQAVMDGAEQRVHDARRVARKQLNRAEDAVDATASSVRRHPFRSVAVAFAAGGVITLIALAAARVRRNGR